MIESIFNGLYAALYGNLIIALIASLLWGIISVLLSPCHLSSIPLVIGLLTGRQLLSVKEFFRLSLVFAAGILVSIALIGVVTAMLGRMLGDLGSHANIIFGSAIILGGILLADIIPLGNSSFLSRIHIDSHSQRNVFIIGLLFGLTLGPCTFAFMAPVLTLVYSLAKTKILMALLIILLYAIGHCSVIVAAGTSITWVQRLMNWNDKSKNLLVLKRVCAGLVIMAGIYLIVK